MSLMTTSVFDNLKLQSDIEKRLIMKIEGESPTHNFYFSDKSFRINDNSVSVPVYGFVKNWGTISTGINLFDKKFKTSTVSISLSNSFIKHTGSVEVRTSYALRESYTIGRAVTFYVWFEGITDINTDGLIVFTGVMQPFKKYDSETLIFDIVDSATKDHIEVPVFLIDDTTYPNALAGSINKPIPLIFGTCTMGERVDGNAFPCKWIAPNKCVLSDKPVNSVSAVWLYDETLNALVKIDSADYTVTLDDSGITTIEFNNPECTYCRFFFWPTSYNDNISGWGTYSNIENAYDRDNDSYALGEDPGGAYYNRIAVNLILDHNYREAGTLTHVGVRILHKTYKNFIWDSNPECISRVVLPYDNYVWLMERCGRLTQNSWNDVPPDDLGYIKDNMKSWNTNEFQVSGDIRFYITIHEYSGVAEETRKIVGNTGDTLIVDGTWDYVHPQNARYAIWGYYQEKEVSGGLVRIYSFADLFKPEGSPREVQLYYQNDPAGARSWSYVNPAQWIYDIHFYAKYTRSLIDENTYGDLATGADIYAECKARTFGSWIDDGDRTPPTGQENEGYIIENPAYIIESILRDDLGLSNSEIDTNAFDAAANELDGWKLAFAITEQVNSINLIEDICKIAKLNYFINGQGLHSMIVLKDSYLTNDYLYGYNIKAGGISIKETQISEIINDLTLKYNIHPVTGEPRSSITVTSSISQSKTKYIRPKTLTTDKIDDDTTAGYLANHICSNTSGFFNIVHYTLMVKMLNWEKIHWDFGDIIQIDSSVDDYVRKGASSWNNTQCMVIGKKIVNGRLEYELIDVGIVGGGSS